MEGHGWRRSLAGLSPPSPSTVRRLLLLTAPGTKELALFAFALAAALRVKPAQPNTGRTHHLFMIFVTEFAGSSLAPMLIGRPPMILIDDLVFPMAVVAWYLVHHSFAGRALSRPLVSLIITLASEVFRAHMVMKVVSLASSSIEPSAFYPIPLFGPVIVGTLCGTLGDFLAFGQGLDAQSCLLQPAQVTFLLCCTYHLALHDPHLVGAYFRGLPLLGLRDPNNVRVLTVLLFVSWALACWACGGGAPEAGTRPWWQRTAFSPRSSAEEALLRPRRPRARTLSALAARLAMSTSSLVETGDRKPYSQHQGGVRVFPPAAASTVGGRLTEQGSIAAAEPQLGTASAKKGGRVHRSRTRLALVVGAHLVLPAMALILHASWAWPRTSMAPGERLYPGDLLAACGMWERYAEGCSQHFLLVGQGSLMLFKGDSPRAGEKNVLVWQAKSKRRGINSMQGEGFFAEFWEDGTLNLMHRDAKKNSKLWSSNKRVNRFQGTPTLRVSPEGAVTVHSATNDVIWRSPRSGGGR